MIYMHQCNGDKMDILDKITKILDEKQKIKITKHMTSGEKAKAKLNRRKNKVKMAKSAKIRKRKNKSCPTGKKYSSKSKTCVKPKELKGLKKRR